MKPSSFGRLFYFNRPRFGGVRGIDMAIYYLALNLAKAKAKEFGKDKKKRKAKKRGRK